MSRVLLTLCLALLLPACSDSRDLSRVLPGSEPFQLDRWEIAIVASRPLSTGDLVQIDVAVQQIDGIGRAAGVGIDSGRKSFEVGRPFVWDRVADTDGRVVQITSPRSRRDGDAFDVTLKVVASENGQVVDTRTLDLRVR